MGTMPTVWNDDNATDAQKSRLLWDIRAHQGPGPIRMMDALRTPLGRPVGRLVLGNCVHNLCQVVAFCEDTTYVKCHSSLDPSWQVRWSWGFNLALKYFGRSCPGKPCTVHLAWLL